MFRHAGGDCDNCDGTYCDSLGIDDIPEDNDTLRLCKGCTGERNSCAGCEDADPNDRHMNDEDSLSDKANRVNDNAERANDEKSSGAGLADSDGIYQR